MAHKMPSMRKKAIFPQLSIAVFLSHHLADDAAFLQIAN